jgi:hypothetical protein
MPVTFNQTGNALPGTDCQLNTIDFAGGRRLLPDCEESCLTISLSATAAGRQEALSMRDPGTAASHAPRIGREKSSWIKRRQNARADTATLIPAARFVVAGIRSTIPPPGQFVARHRVRPI